MKLENIIIENYRQFDTAELAFDQGITILAGANNSGKTSLINLIRSVFVDEKNDYSVSDIPAKNMQEWIDWGYPVFADFFKSGKSVDTIDANLSKYTTIVEFRSGAAYTGVPDVVYIFTSVCVTSNA